MDDKTNTVSFSLKIVAGLFICAGILTTDIHARKAKPGQTQIINWFWHDYVKIEWISEKGESGKFEVRPRKTHTFFYKGMLKALKITHKGESRTYERGRGIEFINSHDIFKMQRGRGEPNEGELNLQEMKLL